MRHASCDHVGAWLAGRSPGVHLNAQGRAEALALAQRAGQLPITAVYSSPLERARETAEPVARAFGLDAVIDPELTEIDYGDWTGKRLEELEEDPLWRRYNAWRSITRVPGGETIAEVQARCVASVERIKRQHGNETVALVSHGDPIRAILMFYLGMPLDYLHRVEVAPASLSELELWDEWIVVRSVNDRARSDHTS
jgi:probable phosphomutase (TIGR03848 family)